MGRLFETTRIRGLVLENRFIRSATREGLATDEGGVTGKLIDLSVALARGGVALIITGHAYVAKEGQAGPWQLGINGDSLVEGHRAMVDAVHSAGGKIVVQLAHAGCRGASALTGCEAIGPSLIEGQNGPLCRAMTDGDIAGITRAFTEAAARAEQAGYDGVQIHAAHGYLISEFLSPFHNKRQDAYGGPVENRARLLLEVVAEVRRAIHPSRSLMVKMNSEDFVDGGFSVDDMLEVAAMLEQAGADALELSGGSPFSPRYTSVRPGPIKSEAEEVYYREAARKYKQRIAAPLMLVGGIRSYTVAERLVEDGETDYISLCRPLIREPGLINRWKSGDTRKAKCVSDNLCFQPQKAGEGIVCMAEKRERGD